jgi:hypothetical protein
LAAHFAQAEQDIGQLMDRIPGDEVVYQFKDDVG